MLSIIDQYNILEVSIVDWIVQQTENKYNKDDNIYKSWAKKICYTNEHFDIKNSNAFVIFNIIRKSEPNNFYRYFQILLKYSILNNGF